MMREQLQATLGAAYILDRELGGGGMSRVFLAEETALGRQVVVKVLPQELLAGVNVERFNREILLAAKLQHPHIVPVLSAGETQGLPYYTMPFVEGESLRARLAHHGALPIAEAVSILRDVAKALAYAHERGIVHRDIKPDNVLLTGGSATVTDFGIAKAISAARTPGSGQTLTQVGTSIGTPTYMAPEQAAADPASDHRADIYSFGCLAYELIAGRPPFTETTPRKLLAAHMAETPLNVAELRPDAPASLVDLVMRCLAKDPADRPQHAGDLVRALESVASSGASPAMPAVLLGGPKMFGKALAIYAAAFVVVAIVAKAAIVGIGLPDWVFPGALIVMALGLPVILWTAYVQRVARRVVTMTPTYTPGGTPSMVHGTMATMALRAAPKMSWYRTARGGVYALSAFVVAIVAFMMMRTFNIGPAATLFGSGALKAREAIVMTDFSVTSGDTSLARVVSFAVRTVLSQSPVLSIMDQSVVAGALERMSRPRTQHVDLALAQGIALREGAKAIVDGEVTTIGTGYVLTLRLVSADSSRVLASFQESGDGPRGLIDAADKVARDLRAKAGESLRSVQNAVPLYRARTSSLEALRLYSEGSYANNVEIDGPKAVRLLRQAVAADSTFAEGWRRLGQAMNNLGLPRPAVDSALEKAYRFRGSLSDDEQASIVGGYYGTGPGRDRAKAIAAYEIAARTVPLIGHNLALLYTSRREFTRAESLYRTELQADSMLALGYLNLSSILVNEGHLDAADSLLAAGRGRLPRTVVLRRQSVLLAYHRGLLNAYQGAVDSARTIRDPADPAWALHRSAGIALLRGHIGQWRTYRAQALAADSSVGRRPGILTSAVQQAQVLALVMENPRANLAELDAALAMKPLASYAESERPSLAVAEALANAGFPARAQALVAEFQAGVRDTALLRAMQPVLHTTLGAIALAQKKSQEALKEFRLGDMAVDGPANGCTICLPLMLGRVFDAGNQPDSAITQYERYIRTPFQSRYVEQFDPSTLPGIHERLGQLYEAKGLAAKAVEHYRAFVDLWKNADPELQPRVAAARERLRTLTTDDHAKR